MKIPIPPSIYFGGCAYGSCFYVGIYRAMLETWGSDFASKTLLTGDSAGIILVVGISLQYSPEFIGQIYCDTGKRTPWGLLGKDPMQALDECTLQKLIVKNAYEKVNKNIWIGGSVFPDKHIWKDCWNSDKELLETIRNSLHVPIICKRRYHTPSNGHEVVDGAFCLTGKDLAHGDATLYIGTNKGADIFTELTWKQKAFPCDNYGELEQLGYNLFMTWVAEGGIIKKKNKKVSYVVQCVLWALKALQKITI